MTDKLSAIDRNALGRALTLAQRESQGRREQIARMLSEDGWLYAAHFASSHCQRTALRLKPWRDPPLYGDFSDDADAAALLKQLLDAGLSRYEPDPADALARIGAAA